MAYSIYLLDGNDMIELDCEDVDFATDFSVADASDISRRNGTRTKSIMLKGSKVNNQALGNLSHQNQVADFTLSNVIGANYNALRPVPCLIYEDGNLLLKGHFFVKDTTITNGNIQYECYVNDSVIDFRMTVSDKLLEDLDFTDLQHRFTWDNVKDSWEQRVETYNPTTQAYQYVPAARGQRYTYPFIEYGKYFQKSTQGDPNIINILNFRPAVYVKEYINRIFAQPGLENYSWELRGSQDLKDRFDSLIIPENSEAIVSKQTGIISAKASSTTTQGRDMDKSTNANPGVYVWINLPTHAGNILQSVGNFKGELPDCVQLVTTAFTANGKASLTMGHFNNSFPGQVKLKLELIERAFVEATSSEFSNGDGWTVVATSPQVVVPPQSGIPATTLNLEIPERPYTYTSQIALRLKIEGLNYINEIFSPNSNYNITGASLQFPKDTNSTITSELLEGSVISVSPIAAVKQIDFLKSILTLMNLYMYTEPEDSKHIIFQQYSDYYGFTQADYLVDSSINWTGKVDDRAWKLTPNTSIPKKYLFTFKGDSDLLNDSYTKNFSAVYGDFKFTDNLGIAEEKKVELVFSSTVMFVYPGTTRLIPGIFTGTAIDRKPTKSNIRILYFLGPKVCNSYTVARDLFIAGGYDRLELATGVTTYGHASNYFTGPGVTNMVPLDSLYFGTPKEHWFTPTEAHLTCPTGYQRYYQGQITDLTNPNVKFLTCEVALTSVDIANLDLRTPVFIDFGEHGNGYYKVLSVEYVNSDLTSTVKLQKIPV